MVGSKFRPINEPLFWTENVHSNAQDNRYVQGNKLHRGECVLHTPGNWRCQSVWANSCLATDSSPLLSAHHVYCCTDALVLACLTPCRSRCVVLSAHTLSDRADCGLCGKRDSAMLLYLHHLDKAAVHTTSHIVKYSLSDGGVKCCVFSQR